MATSNSESGETNAEGVPESRRELGRATDKNLVPKHAAFYISNVMSEWETTKQGPVEDDKIARDAQQIAQRIVKKDDPWTWADLYALEIAIVRLQTKERLVRRICILREKYRRAFGDTAYNAYLKCSGLPNPNNANIPTLRAEMETLRAEMETLLQEFHWLYSAKSAREGLFRRLRLNLTWPVAALAVPLVGWIWWDLVMHGTQVPGLLIVMFVGVAGAFTSILRRIQIAQSKAPATTGDSVKDVAELGLGNVSVFIALATGAIFPVVIMLVFIGGMLQGSLFPSMITPTESDDGGLAFLDFAFETGPETGVDFAKLLVWAFISGFAERFVPDVLDKFATRGKEAASGDGEQ